MWPLVIAVDAGPVQIQSWEGAALRRVATVLHGTRHDTLGTEIGHGEKVSRRPWSQKLKQEIGLTARRGDTERPEGAQSFRVEESGLMPQR